MGQSIVITSGKGGTGKTSLTAGISSCLAALGRRTVCIDADVGLRNLDIALGLSESALFDFNDVINRRIPLKDALIEHPQIPQLSMLPAPAGLTADLINEKEFNRMVRELAEQVDFVLVDCPAGLDAGFSLATGSCERAIVVVTPDLISVRDGARTAQLLTGHDPVHMVVNRVRPAMIRGKFAPNLDDAMDTTGLPLLGIVPEDEMVMAAANRSSALVLNADDGAAPAFLNIARRLLGENVPLMKIKQWKMQR